MGSFVPGSVTVEDARGQTVDVTVNEGPSPGCPGTWAEIIPKQPWAPRTTYVVRVQPMYPDAGIGKDNYRFVTGVDSLEDSELAVPKTRASLLTGLPDTGAACTAFSLKTCINVEGQTEDQRDVEVIVRRGDRIMLRTLMWVNDMDFGFAERPDCLELRRRSPTGKRSKPVMLCGKDLPATALKNTGGDWSTWPACKDGAFKQQTSPGTSELPAPHVSAAGTGASPPSAAGGEDDSASDDDSHSEDDPASSHREYGCAAIPRVPGTRAPIAMLAAIAAGAAVRRRRAAKRA
jgi:hypothetical protein